MVLITCVGSSAKSITALPDLSGVGSTVAHFFCSSVRSIRVLCDLSVMGMEISISLPSLIWAA